jgi:hypothetical protein
MQVYVLTRPDTLGCPADDFPVLDYIFPRLDIPEGELVPEWDIPAQ